MFEAKLSIFIQDEDGSRTNICNFHRSHPVYDALYDVRQWDEVVAIDWQRALITINNYMDYLRDEMSKYEELAQRMQNCNNTIDEKNKYISRYVDAKKDIESALKEQEAAKSYIELLKTISETSGKKLVAGIGVNIYQGNLNPGGTGA